MISIELNLHLTKGQNEYVSLDVNGTDKVEVLMESAVKQSNMSSEEILLLLGGDKLEPCKTVAEVGLVSGDCVHCFPIAAPRVDEATPLTTVEVYELHAGITRFMRSRDHRAFFTYIQKLEFGEQAMKCVAGAWRDPDALVMLEDAVIMKNITRDSPENLGRLVADRPVFGRLAQHMLEEFRKEAPNLPTISTSAPPPPSAFSLDSLYEQDDSPHDYDFDDASRGAAASGSSAAGGSGGGGAALPAITPAQLASALANATGMASGRGAGAGGGPSNMATIAPPHRGGASITATPSNTPASLTSSSHTPPSAPHTPASASASTPHQQHGQLPNITSEMLNNALQSVLGAAAAGGGSSSSPASPRPPPTPSSATPAPSIPNLEESVRLMADMGIPDEALCRQALHMTGGDLQAAVDLVLVQLNM